MTILKFKTTINCSGCIAKASPFLDKTTGIDKWEVELTNPRKILTVETSTLSGNDIIQGLTKLGFKVEAL